MNKQLLVVYIICCCGAAAIIVSSSIKQQQQQGFVECKCGEYPYLIPGGDVLKGAFDVTKLSTNNENGAFGSDVFQYSSSSSGGEDTHNQNRRCMVNLEDPSKTCYLVPYEMSLHVVDSSVTKEVAQLNKEYYDHVRVFSESYSSSFSVGVPEMHASVQYHEELYESQELMTQSYQSQGYALYSQYWYTLSLPPLYVMKLDPLFEYSLNALPSTIENEIDNNQYIEFLNAYGGYCLQSVIMGGSFHMNQYVEQSYVMSNSQTETMTQMNIGFSAQMFNMNYGYSSNSSEYKTSESYRSSSVSTITCYGGNMSLECGSNEWMLSIGAYPNYLNVSYVPLYMLIYDDEYKYATLKEKTISYTQSGILV